MTETFKHEDFSVQNGSAREPIVDSLKLLAERRIVPAGKNTDSETLKFDNVFAGTLAANDRPAGRANFTDMLKSIPQRTEALVPRMSFDERTSNKSVHDGNGNPLLERPFKQETAAPAGNFRLEGRENDGQQLSFASGDKVLTGKDGVQVIGKDGKPVDWQNERVLMSNPPKFTYELSNGARAEKCEGVVTIRFPNGIEVVADKEGIAGLSGARKEGGKLESFYKRDVVKTPAEPSVLQLL